MSTLESREQAACRSVFGIEGFMARSNALPKQYKHFAPLWAQITSGG